MHMGCKGVKATRAMIDSATQGHAASSAAPSAAGGSHDEEASRRLYNAMNSAESRLGGGEGNVGLYGTIRNAGMQKIMHSLREMTGMGRLSRFLDVGAGLGRPCLHALLPPGVARSRGIELDAVKVTKGDALLSQVYNDPAIRPLMKGQLPTLKVQDIQNTAHIDDTHLFSFWEGLPTSAKIALGGLVSRDKEFRGIAVVGRGLHRDPVQEMADLGFPPLQLVSKIPVHMAKGTERFTAFVFKRG